MSTTTTTSTTRFIHPPKYPWFQRPAPTAPATLVVAAILILTTLYFYHRRVQKLRSKFAPNEFTGSLRTCAFISAYMDHHDEPSFAILRVATKSILFLGICQWKYQLGFIIMMVLLVLEANLDTIRILLSYKNCKRLGSLSVIADDEAHDLHTATSQLVPTNVYEDLSRPQAISILVFLTQVLLVGLVMDDSLRTTTRTCFNGKDGCPVLTSLGSYCLYLIGTFMSCVFYVGPRNSYGKKEINPTFWLKLLLLTKESPSLTFRWHDEDSDQDRTLTIHGTVSIWFRFTMSAVVNGAGFLFLLHVLPIQVAGQANAIGVVFRAVGMIYLVDLDDTVGNILTLVDSNSTNTSAGLSRTGFLSMVRHLGETITTIGGNDDGESPDDEATGLLT